MLLTRDSFVESMSSTLKSAYSKGLGRHIQKKWEQMQREANRRHARWAKGALICAKKNHIWESKIWQHKYRPNGLYLNWNCNRCGADYYKYENKTRI